MTTPRLQKNKNNTLGWKSSAIIGSQNSMQQLSLQVRLISSLEILWTCTGMFYSGLCPRETATRGNTRPPITAAPASPFGGKPQRRDRR